MYTIWSPSQIIYQTLFFFCYLDEEQQIEVRIKAASLEYYVDSKAITSKFVSRDTKIGIYQDYCSTSVTLISNYIDFRKKDRRK